MGKLIGKDLLDFLSNANRTYDWQMTDLENSVVYSACNLGQDGIVTTESFKIETEFGVSCRYDEDRGTVEADGHGLLCTIYELVDDMYYPIILLGQEFDYKSFAQYQEGKTWWEIQSFDPSIPESCSEELMEKLCKLALELGQLSTDDGELDEYLISNGIAFDSVGFANLLWKSFLQIRQIYTQLEDTYANIEVADLFQYYDDDSINNRNDALEYANGIIDELVD